MFFANFSLFGTYIYICVELDPACLGFLERWCGPILPTLFIYICIYIYSYKHISSILSLCPSAPTSTQTSPTWSLLWGPFCSAPTFLTGLFSVASTLPSSAALSAVSGSESISFHGWLERTGQSVCYIYIYHSRFTWCLSNFTYAKQTFPVVWRTDRTCTL